MERIASLYTNILIRNVCLNATEALLSFQELEDHNGTNSSSNVIRNMMVSCVFVGVSFLSRFLFVLAINSFGYKKNVEK